jgi:predicted Kef-type K+ transport protein
VGAGIGDERDRTIMTQALATTGYVSFLTLTGLCVALVCGAGALPSATIAMFFQIGVFVAAFAVHARRA